LLSAEQQNVKPENGFTNLQRRSANYSDDDDTAAADNPWGAAEAPAMPSVPSDATLFKEAKRVHRAWRAMAKTVPWERYLPSLKDRADEIRCLKEQGEDSDASTWNVVFDLLRVPLKRFIADIKRLDPERKRYGFLPYMAKTWLGRLMAESFSERMISNANIVITPGNMRLNPVEMEQLVVLRMNRAFMAYCKLHYANELAAYIKAIETDSATHFLATTMAEPHSFFVDPQPAPCVSEEDIAGVEVTLVPISY